MPKCPKCGEDLMIDVNTNVYFCVNCSRTMVEEIEQNDEILDDDLDEQDDDTDIDECNYDEGVCRNGKYFERCPKCKSDKIAFEEDEEYYFCSECGFTFDTRGKKVQVKTEDNEGYWIGFFASLILNVIGMLIVWLCCKEKEGLKKGMVHGLIFNLIGIIIALVLGFMFE